MSIITCQTARAWLAAYHDDELPVGDRIAVQGHVNGCAACDAELEGFAAVRAALRLAGAPVPADDWRGLQPGVIGRMRAEANEAWGARLGRMFDDMHLVWIGFAAAAGTLVCGTVVLAMLHFASPELDSSLAAMIAVAAAPSGSNLNPVSLDALMHAPSVPDDGLVKASLERSGQEGELMLALSAVITREGQISGVEVVDGRGQHSPMQVARLLNGLSRGRLVPARSGDDPVAVNLVWVVEHMTVKGTPAAPRRPRRALAAATS